MRGDGTPLPFSTTYQKWTGQPRIVVARKNPLLLSMGNVNQAVFNQISSKTSPKDIIHALLTLSKVIADEPEVSKWMQIVFIENYNVTAAEKIIPVCDLSEQIRIDWTRRTLINISKAGFFSSDRTIE